MDMLAELFSYLLYLFHGLVFLTMGAAITSKVTRASTLGIARSLWLFSLFAFIHAFHEWSELYMVLTRATIGKELLLVIKAWKLLPVFLSFFLLLLFGLRVLGMVFPASRRRLLLLPAALLLLSA